MWVILFCFVCFVFADKIPDLNCSEFEIFTLDCLSLNYFSPFNRSSKPFSNVCCNQFWKQRVEFSFLTNAVDSIGLYSLDHFKNQFPKFLPTKQLSKVQLKFEHKLAPIVVHCETKSCLESSLTQDRTVHLISSSDIISEFLETPRNQFFYYGSKLLKSGLHLPDGISSKALDACMNGANNVCRVNSEVIKSNDLLLLPRNLASLSSRVSLMDYLLDHAPKTRFVTWNIRNNNKRAEFEKISYEDCRSMFSPDMFWVFDSLLYQSIPIFPRECSFFYPNNSWIQDFPVLYTSNNLFWEIQMNNTFPNITLGCLYSSIVSSLQSESWLKRTSILNSLSYFLDRDIALSLSGNPSFLAFEDSYWTSLVYPWTIFQEHISRGNSRYQLFLKEMKEFSASSLPSSSSKKRLPNWSVEIVIPRCCEEARGDLSWIRSISKSFPLLKFTIVYKCPWCLPNSFFTTSMGEEQHQWSNWYRIMTGKEVELGNKTNGCDKTSLLQEFYSPLRRPNCSTVSNLFLMDSIKSGKVKCCQRLDSERDSPIRDLISQGRLREVIGWDVGVNGKEVTAYLTHIWNHYHEIANITYFLHTQPAHHLDIQRFFRSLIYVATNWKEIDYFYLNYRWKNGMWAHQPERCMMKLIPHLFSPHNHESMKMMDQKRQELIGNNVSFVSVEEFLRIPMGSGVAAQFFVSRTAIQRRSREFWKKLLELNRGKPLIEECDSRSYELGSLVASGMERLWHNFFLNDRGLKDPFYFPSIAEMKRNPQMALKSYNIPSQLLIESGYANYHDGNALQSSSSSRSRTIVSK